MTTLEELEKRIAAQEDLRAIERLQANYWDYLDAKNWEGLRSILIEDFVFINNTTGGRYEGRDGMLSTMEGKFCDGVISSHQGHHHWVELVDETHAISHWSLEDDLYDSKHGGEFVGRAHYDNKYVKIDGRWYFEEMSLTYLRGKGEIKKLADDCANAYKVFMM
ncbi:nuclear transport factor 2 family protein [uncultured Ellagibacter sp.]|uniref:nuclear transport factor 2 family protein n=1 Tax=uncultured Ellagibacter sp. TaxID=2137580 RepID=UPI0026353D40|nr:nuclear transport factor 2 family protein [uncultured Ellagibacter sp.]